MTDEITYKNNPLHGVGLKKMLTELTDHYGFEILFAYLNINCFKTNPSVASSVKFLKKTDWAREKVEGFYLYSFKNLPKPTHEQHQLSPRDRLIPDDQTVGSPAELSLEEAEQMRAERENKAAEYDSKARSRASRAHNAERSRGQSSSSRNHSRPASSRPASKPSNRSASTASNPWGIKKSSVSQSDDPKGDSTET